MKGELAGLAKIHEARRLKKSARLLNGIARMYDPNGDYAQRLYNKAKELKERAKYLRKK